MALYLLLGIVGGLAVLWLGGYLLSALLDARRPQEAEGAPQLSESDTLQTVQRLSEEWQQVRRHWVKSVDSDDDRRAA